MPINMPDNLSDCHQSQRGSLAQSIDVGAASVAAAGTRTPRLATAATAVPALVSRLLRPCLTTPDYVLTTVVAATAPTTVVLALPCDASGTMLGPW